MGQSLQLCSHLVHVWAGGILIFMVFFFLPVLGTHTVRLSFCSNKLLHSAIPVIQTAMICLFFFVVVFVFVYY